MELVLGGCTDDIVCWITGGKVDGTAPRAGVKFDVVPESPYSIFMLVRGETLPACVGANCANGG